LLGVEGSPDPTASLLERFKGTRLTRPAPPRHSPPTWP